MSKKGRRSGGDKPGRSKKDRTDSEESEVEMEETDTHATWDCTVCTFKNRFEAFKCEMCDARFVDTRLEWFRYISFFGMCRHLDLERYLVNQVLELRYMGFPVFSYINSFRKGTSTRKPRLSMNVVQQQQILVQSLAMNEGKTQK